MNIKDSGQLDRVVIESIDAFEYLYGMQFGLYVKYKDIEKMPTCHPFDIDSCECQCWIKDFFWRVTEELMEAFEALDQQHYEHFLEELSDALHFYLDVFVVLDYGTKMKLDDYIKEHRLVVVNKFDYVDSSFACIYEMAMAANCLRNKKWKQSQVLVDVNKFAQHLDGGFHDLIDLILNSIYSFEGESSSDDLKYRLLNLYQKKHQVNQFRIRSNY